jgi:hypothetical protein
MEHSGIPISLWELALIGSAHDGLYNALEFQLGGDRGRTKKIWCLILNAISHQSNQGCMEK